MLIGNNQNVAKILHQTEHPKIGLRMGFYFCSARPNKDAENKRRKLVLLVFWSMCRLSKDNYFLPNTKLHNFAKFEPSMAKIENQAICIFLLCHLCIFDQCLLFSFDDVIAKPSQLKGVKEKIYCFWKVFHRVQYWARYLFRLYKPSANFQ